MKSKIELRIYAVDKAIAVMGCCSPTKDVVDKAREIEQYIVGDAVLPEVSDEASPMDIVNNLAALVSKADAGV